MFKKLAYETQVFFVVKKLKLSYRFGYEKLMEQHALKNVNNCLNTNIYSYLETSGGQSSNPYLNVVHFFNTRVDKKSLAV
jgi:hypothetical protein